MTAAQAQKRMVRMIQPRALALLQKVQEGCPNVPFCEPRDISCDDYAWDTVAKKHNKKYNLDEYVSVVIEAHISEDYGESPGGVNFGLRVFGLHGEIVALYEPHNYTEDVWVRIRDKKAMDERMAELEALNVEELCQIISDYWGEERGWTRMGQGRRRVANVLAVSFSKKSYYQRRISDANAECEK